jgi:hypothetical protein
MTVPDPAWSWRAGLNHQQLDEDGHLPADQVTYDPTTSGLTATDAQAAIDELVAGGSAGGSGNVYTDETQAVQSKRYLMQDGTFRNPLLVGDGVLSVGSISTITSGGSRYKAWPSICRMRGNQLLLGYTDADSHHTDNTGKAVGRVGVEGFGGVITWGPEFDIYDDPSDWVSLVGLCVLSTGRIIASLFQDHVGSGTPLDGAYIAYSDDEGASWTRVLVNSTLSSYSYGSGRALELPNGDVLQCVEGKNSGDTFSRMVVMRSTDHGESWPSQVTIATGTRDYYEACLGLLDDDTVGVLLRTTDGNGDIYQSISPDGGVTWPAPTLAFAGHGQPNWIQLSTGTTIAGTRENDGSLQGDALAYTSTDRWATWSAATTLDGSMYEMEYVSFLELLDGRVLFVEGYQPTSAITVSHIKGGYVSEGVTTIGSSSALVVKDEGSTLDSAVSSIDVTGAWATATNVGHAVTLAVPARALDDLTDATITSPALGDRLRYNGSAWVNSPLIWAPVMVLDPGTGNYLVLTDTSGNAIMAEV